MPEDAQSDQPTAPAQEPGPTPDEGAGPEPPADLAAEVEKWKQIARKHEADAAKATDRAKGNSAAVQELERLRKASMTEQERAVAAARDEASRETSLRYGGRLVDAEVRAAAHGRPIDVPTLLEGLDRSRFLTEDGEPDVKAIAAWVEKLSPPPPEPTSPVVPGLGQGARTSTASQSSLMNSAMRAARR